MSWQTDKEPIDYLRRRIIYYKKKKPGLMKLINNPNMVTKYGKKELEYLIAKRLLTIQSYIDMFKKAVNDLETIEEIENKVQNQEPLKQ